MCLESRESCLLPCATRFRWLLRLHFSKVSWSSYCRWYCCHWSGSGQLDDFWQLRIADWSWNHGFCWSWRPRGCDSKRRLVKTAKANSSGCTKRAFHSLRLVCQPDSGFLANMLDFLHFHVAILRPNGSLPACVQWQVFGLLNCRMLMENASAFNWGRWQISCSVTSRLNY